MITLRSRNSRRGSELNIFSEAGRPIPSVFQGAGIRLMPRATKGSGPVCSKKQSWLERLFSVASVQAANCYEGGCGGTIITNRTDRVAKPAAAGPKPGTLSIRCSAAIATGGIIPATADVLRTMGLGTVSV